MENLITLDTEIYKNYFLLSFKSLTTDKVVSFEARGSDTTLSAIDCKQIDTLMQSRHTFGFNSNSFDIPIIYLAISGATVATIKNLADKIINDSMQPWQTFQMLGAYPPKWLHFDIKEVAIGVQVSLKLYGGRLHCPKLQDLPYPPDAVLTDSQMDDVKLYCENDLDTTISLYKEVKPAVDLRDKISDNYGLDLLSKSDAQIAEALIKKEIETLKGCKVNKLKPMRSFKYKAPDYVEFKTPKLQQLLATIENITFQLNDNGQVVFPDELKEKIVIGESKYSMGIGGLHSNEKCQHYIATDTTLICDRDVASYYPSMIINNKWYPKQLGVEFITFYKNIYDKRIAAKHSAKLIKKEMNNRGI